MPLPGGDRGTKPDKVEVFCGLRARDKKRRMVDILSGAAVLGWLGGRPGGFPSSLRFSSFESDKWVASKFSSLELDKWVALGSFGCRACLVNANSGWLVKQHFFWRTAHRIS